MKGGTMISYYLSWKGIMNRLKINISNEHNQTYGLTDGKKKKNIVRLKSWAINSVNVHIPWGLFALFGASVAVSVSLFVQF